MPKGMRKVVGPGFVTRGAASRIEKEKVAVAKRLKEKERKRIASRKP